MRRVQVYRNGILAGILTEENRKITCSVMTIHILQTVICRQSA